MNNESKNRKGESKPHALVKTLLGQLVQDKEGRLHLREKTYTQLHAGIDQIESARELATLAESLLQIAINLDQQMNSEEASNQVGLLAKLAADKAISLNSKMTNALDRVSENAAYYQKFTAQKRPIAFSQSQAKTNEGIFKLCDLDPNRRKA